MWILAPLCKDRNDSGNEPEVQMILQMPQRKVCFYDISDEEHYFFNWMWGLYKNSRFHTNYSPSSIKIHWMPCFPDYYLCFVLVLCLAGHGSRTWSLSNSWKLVPSVHTGISTYVLGNHCCGKMQANCWFDSQQWVINLTMTCCCGLDLFVNMFFVLMMALCGT